MIPLDMPAQAETVLQPFEAGGTLLGNQVIVHRPQVTGAITLHRKLLVTEQTFPGRTCC